MDNFYINGGAQLHGELELYPAKNALLPILASSVMSNGTVVIKNVSKFSDVNYMIEILQGLGAVATYEGNDLHLDMTNTEYNKISEEQTKKVRSSIFMLGSLLSRFKKAEVSYPGGCNIGTRPIDLHLKGLRALNADIKEEDGFIICDGTNMKSGVVEFSFPSVGATENIMMAAVMLPGKSVIINAAREPEIVDLQNFLNAMGAKISGAGTKVISIEGVSSLSGVEYLPISDRIVAGTYLIAVAGVGGNVTIKNTNPAHNLALIKHLKQAGVKLRVKENEINIQSNKRLKALKNVQTAPFPGFATDLQSQLLAVQTLAKGKTKIVENLYETRFKIVPELIKMGANITINERTATVLGVEKLYGAKVLAPDLRSGAGLVIAGMMAEGQTVIGGIENIERGYLHFDKDLASLGADIKRIEKK